MKKIALLLVFMVFAVIAFFTILTQKVAEPLIIEQPEIITITSGTSMHKFSKLLVNKGWLENRFWIRAYIRLFPELGQIKTGSYQVTSADTAKSLLEKLVAGKEHQFTITFVEGSQLKDWQQQLSNQYGIEQTASTQTPTAIANALSIEQNNPEGWFFPDTYAYTLGTEDIEIFARAYQRMQQELTVHWQQRAIGLPYDNPYQVLIMASIIEKETGLVSEQPTIASVFINRLNKRMRLQTDPTVIYGIGERYKGDITRAHLREKTAYNTYRINGLPPTPIAMPGLSALKASVNPADTDLLYFVSKGDGSHQFSQTLKQHNQAVAKFQLGKN